jgi:hypothetical protein
MSLRLPTIIPISVALASAAYASDLKIVTTTRIQSNGHASTVTRYSKDQRSRTEWRNESGGPTKPGEPATYTYGPPRATIFQCDEHRALDLNLQDHEYTLHELDEQGRPKGVKPIAISTKASGGTLTINVETIDTGERKQIFGRTARHIIRREKRVASPGACGRSGETESDGWYTDLETRNGCVATPKAHAGVATVGILVAGGSQCMDKIEVHATGTAAMGFPLKLTTTSRDAIVLPDGTSKEITSTFENEVTELSEEPLDPALFELPAGFTQVTTLKDQPPVPASAVIREWWERMKRSVRSWFG